MSNTGILQVCARLDADKQWCTFFDILRDYGDTLSAVWLKGEKELSLSFAEMTRRADDLARDALLRHPGRAARQRLDGARCG